MNWQDVYKLPLWYDGQRYAWTQDNNMALMFNFDVIPEEAQAIVDTINGERNYKIPNYNGLIDVRDGEDLLFTIRGWGHLVGTGGLNLPVAEAEEIQNGFAEFVKTKLSNDRI